MQLRVVRIEMKCYFVVYSAVHKGVMYSHRFSADGTKFLHLHFSFVDTKRELVAHNC